MKGFVKQRIERIRIKTHRGIEIHLLQRKQKENDSYSTYKHSLHYLMQSQCGKVFLFKLITHSKVKVEKVTPPPLRFSLVLKSNRNENVSILSWSSYMENRDNVHI